jgi:plastocyanin
MNVNLHSVRLCSFLRHIVPYLLLTILTISLSPALHAASWDVLVGAQSHDKGSQSLAFFPNELWVHVGDSVTWHFQTDEIHTVTFLKIGQARPSFQEGCPGMYVFRRSWTLRIRK